MIEFNNNNKNKIKYQNYSPKLIIKNKKKKQK